ncbi:MAG: hypothetical protein ACOVP1_08675, partial [Bacteroidia bacterium]
MQEHDKILKVLGDKLRNYEAGEASDADWAAFQAVYPAKNKKKRAFLWFLLPLVGISSVLLAWYAQSQFKAYRPTAAVVLSPNASPLAQEKTLAIRKSQSNLVSSNHQLTKSLTPQVLSSKKNKSRLEKSNNKSSQSHTPKQKTKAPSAYTSASANPKRNALASSAPLTVLSVSQPEGKMESKLIAHSGKSLAEQKNEKLKQDENISQHEPQISNPINPEMSNKQVDSLPEKTSLNSNNNNRLDSNMNKPHVHPKQLKLNMWLRHLDMAGLFSPAMRLNEPSLESNPLFGAGLSLAFGINKNWFWSTGLQYMTAQSNNRIQQEVPHHFSTITKIDTTLKFDVSASIIMMNIDTHFQNHIGTRIDEVSIVRNSQVFSLPLLFGYVIGNQKTELSLFSGIQNDWLVERLTRNNLTLKTNETFTSQKLLVAPLVGFGISRKFYSNWA